LKNKKKSNIRKKIKKTQKPLNLFTHTMMAQSRMLINKFSARSISSPRRLYVNSHLSKRSLRTTVTNNFYPTTSQNQEHSQHRVSPNPPIGPKDEHPFTTGPTREKPHTEGHTVNKAKEAPLSGNLQKDSSKSVVGKFKDALNQFVSTGAADVQSENAAKGLREHNQSSNETKETIGSVKETVDNLQEKAKESYETAKETAKKAFDSVKNDTKQVLQSTKDILQNTTKDYQEKGRDTWQSAQEKGKGLKESGSAFAQEKMKSFQEKGQDIKEKSQETMKSAREKGQDIKENSQETVKSAQEKGKGLKDSSPELLNSLKGKGQDVLKKTQETGQGTVKNLQDQVKSGVNKLNVNMGDTNENISQGSEKREAKEDLANVKPLNRHPSGPVKEVKELAQDIKKDIE